MKSNPVQDLHIGVDVSKAKLDIYVPAAKEGARPATTEVDNDIEGFRKLRDLARKAQAVVCVEPTFSAAVLKSRMISDDLSGSHPAEASATCAA